ncbi:MAG: SCE4755 family polysaccharide monooxygenase-like protein [Myxococcaceae bacterium]
MRTLPLAVALCSSLAVAHIKLDVPDNFQVVDVYGGPNKAAPCGGAGTASNKVTTVIAGSQLTVSWTETILHPGHFRIGIAQLDTEFVTPTPVLDQGGLNCASAPIQTNPTAPIIVDGLFPHTMAAPNNTWSTTVTVPMMSCDHCVLQLMQFMSSHGPPCFYYQCAVLKIVMPDAGVAMDAGTDAGMAPSDAGTDAGQMQNDAGTMPTTDAGSNPDPMPMGCGCSTGPWGVLVLPFLGLLFRRRR